MYTSYYQSALGAIRITASGTGLLSVWFIKEDDGAYMLDRATPNDITRDTAAQLHEYFEGQRQHFSIPLAPGGTPFQRSVWNELTRIPFGRTESYSTIAGRLNNPLSVRAVGTANGQNPIAIIIPCHRVIGADGSLTGYAGGLWRKEYLLKLEGRSTPLQTTLW